MVVSKRNADKIRKATYEKWMHTENSVRYKAIATEAVYEFTTLKIEAEILDGIFLRLNVRNQSKSSIVQNRLLRRIVEKRQAQANHKKNGRSYDRSSMRLSICCTSKCIKGINKKRRAA